MRYGHYYFNGNEAFLGGMDSDELHRVSPQFSFTFSYNIRSGFACPGIAFGEEHTMSNRYALPILPRPPFASIAVVRE